MVLALACTSPEQRAEQARADVEEAIAQGSREAALDAIEDLRQVAETTPEARLELARLLVRAGDAPEAAWLLEETARRHPGHTELALAMARVSLLLGDPARAGEVASAVGPDAGAAAHVTALVLHAQAELQLGDLERALAILAEAERRYPERPEARLARIATLLSEGRPEAARTAVEEARAALAGDGEEARALRRHLDLTLAGIRAQQGESEAALAALDALLEEDPADLMAWQAWVQVMDREERAEEALARIEAALAQESVPAALHGLAARMQAALGRTEAAEATLRGYVERSRAAVAYEALATHHSERGDADAVLAVLDEALAHHPDEPALRRQRAEALLALGRVEAARAEVGRFRASTFEGDPQVEYLEARLALADGDAEGAARRLRTLAPRLDRADVQLWLGRALEASGDLDGARRRYGLARRRDPNWTAPPAALLSLEQRRGDWSAAAALARELTARAPHEMSAWSAWVLALERLGEGEAAEAVAQRVRERFPDRPEARLLLARALRAQGRIDEALAALADAEAGAGELADQVAAARIRTLGMAGRVQEALAAAGRAAATHPESAEVHAARASALFAAGAAEAGARATDRALALAPEEPAPLRDRCLFRTSTGRWIGARDDCARYLEARPEDAETAFARAVALQQLGETAKAIAAYRRAAELDEDDARPHNNLAGLLARSGDLEGALDAAHEAYRLDETDPYVMDTLGGLYLEAGLVERAISVLEDARARAPELSDAKLHLGLAYLEAGRAAEARALLAAVAASEDAAPALRARAREALDGRS